jgi:hypothetical protein
MPLLGFTVFKDNILDGSKRQTIRMLRKYPIKIGDKLYLYWKLRTKQCEKLGEAICTEHFLIYMGKDESENKTTYRLMKQVNETWVSVSTTEWVDIAKRDGFKSDLEMFQWFDKRMGCVFEVIRW